MRHFICCDNHYVEKNESQLNKIKDFPKQICKRYLHFDHIASMSYGTDKRVLPHRGNIQKSVVIIKFFSMSSLINGINININNNSLIKFNIGHAHLFTAK